MDVWAAVELGRVIADTVSSNDSDPRKKWMALRAGYIVPDGMGDFTMREQFTRLSNGHVTIKRVAVSIL